MRRETSGRPSCVIALYYYFLFCFLIPFPCLHRLFLFLRPLTLSFFFVTLFSPYFALSISGLCLLYGSRDQIRFTSGLNACSRGLLHLKGNSFSRNFVVQFETRLMLANFTPPFFPKCFLHCPHQLLMDKGHMPLCNGDFCASQQKQHNKKRFKLRNNN